MSSISANLASVGAVLVSSAIGSSLGGITLATGVVLNVVIVATGSILNQAKEGRRADATAFLVFRQIIVWGIMKPLLGFPLSFIGLCGLTFVHELTLELAKNALGLKFSHRLVQ